MLSCAPQSSIPLEDQKCIALCQEVCVPENGARGQNNIARRLKRQNDNSQVSIMSFQSCPGYESGKKQTSGLRSSVMVDSHFELDGGCLAGLQQNLLSLSLLLQCRSIQCHNHQLDAAQFFGFVHTQCDVCLKTARNAYFDLLRRVTST